jgi:hypothetical protein
MKKYLIILPALIGFNCAVHALESGASFLKIDSDARAVSMGSAYTALASGVSAISYNLSGLSRTNRVEVGFSHTNWLLDSKHDFIGIAIPVKSGVQSVGRQANSGWVAGLGITRLSNSSTEVRNADRSAGGSFNAYDQAVSVGLGRAIGKNRLGFGVKYLESYIAGEKACGAAIDLGLSRVLNTRLPMTVGLSMQNLGAGMKYLNQRDPLPLSFSAGLSFSVIPGINLAFDAKRLIYDKRTNISFGTEYAVLSGLSLRSGYLANTNIGGFKNRGFAAGIGLNLWNANLDYAVTPFGELGNTQKITVKKSF